MDRPPAASPSPRPNARLRWYIPRVIALVAVLAVPVLVTSYALVSNASAAIRSASTHRAELASFSHIVDLLQRIEKVHRDITDRDSSAERRDRIAVDHAFAQADGAYARTTTLPHAEAVWGRWREAWLRAGSSRSIWEIDRVMDAMDEIDAKLDDHSPLEADSGYMLEHLLAATLRYSPRSIVAIRRTADELSAVSEPALTPSHIERLATSRALASQPLARLFRDISLALESHPELGAHINPIFALAQTHTAAFETHVDRILATFHTQPRDRVAGEALARQAIDAHIALWVASEAAADGLVAAHSAMEVHRRRIIVALSLAAIGLGALALTLIGRDTVHAGGLERVVHKLERDKLHAVDQQAQAERALRLQEAQFQNVFEGADLGVVLFDPDGTVVQCNAAAHAMLGDRVQRFLTEQAVEIAAFATVREPVTREELHEKPDGSRQWLALKFSGVYDDATCHLVVLLLRDTTDERLMRQELLHAADHDGLTQLANRTAFEHELRTRLTRTDKPFALFYIDLDEFKPIHDRWGDAAGDQVLVAIAGRLRSGLKSRDLCARLGGEEFAAIVTGHNDYAQLRSIAARLGKSIAAPIAFGEHSLTVTASIGIAVRSGAHCTGDAIKIDADRALYRVKSQGGNGNFIFTPAPSAVAAPAY